ncbi:NnrU protein [Roseivivax sp. THAF40]|uniref:NnrU family protein n=1 Tax=unclassified Roseivivax TaxID=2639302 RepID=UPI001268CB08|nr:MULTISPECIES: NnrU family protein [unclassified Roseivivax]QFS81468.1 NnrU protein [Roseivivax sp. THAF197b]QFT45197.1 NnrU protein [Roseivivax sp. THAF40]
MLLMIFGIALWVGAHLFKRLAPDMRENMGNAGKGIVAVVILAGLAAMIFGYRSAPYIGVWTPPGFLVHVNNLLMLGAVFLYGMSATTGRLRGAMRHPQLTAVKVWAVAHLLVNGDLAAIILFGSLLAWAVVEVIVINRTTDWERPAPGPAKKDIVLVVITIVMYVIITGIHAWLGVWPFGS